MTASKIENIKMKQSQETRIALLEQSISHINENILRIERKIDERFDSVDRKIDGLEKKIDKFDSRLWSNFYWMLSTMFTLACAGAAVLAKGFGWLD